jgi:hypothetical protein
MLIFALFMEKSLFNGTLIVWALVIPFIIFIIAND